MRFSIKSALAEKKKRKKHDEQRNKIEDAFHIGDVLQPKKENELLRCLMGTLCRCHSIAA